MKYHLIMLESTLRTNWFHQGELPVGHALHTSRKWKLNRQIYSLWD